MVVLPAFDISLLDPRVNLRSDENEKLLLIVNVKFNSEAALVLGVASVFLVFHEPIKYPRFKITVLGSSSHYVTAPSRNLF
jgi:hypothetical protein